MSTNSHTPTLLQAQRWLQQRVLDETPAEIADGEMVLTDLACSAEYRVGIYRDAYRLRLIEVLRNDYRLLLSVLLEAGFEQLGLRYLREHPSRHPSARWFGQALPEWLSDEPALAAIASFEWTQAACFDGPDADCIVLEDLAGLPADVWPTLLLGLHPSVRLLATRYELAPLLRRESRDEPMLGERERSWLLWRHERQVQWRLLDDDEVDALVLVAKGASFGDLCESLCAWHAANAVALRAAALLKRWIVDGLVSRLDVLGR